MGAVLAKLPCCAIDATFVVDELVNLLEGEKKTVKKIPLVVVTIDKIDMKDSGSVRFTPVKFALKGMLVKTTIDVTGEASDISNLAQMQVSKVADSMVSDGLMDAAKAAKSSFHKTMTSNAVGSTIVSGAGAVAGGIGAVTGAVTGTVGKVAGKASDMTRTTTTIKVEVTVDLVKEYGDEDVTVVISDFNTDIMALQALMQIDVARAFIEASISEKATEKVNKIIDKVQAKVGLA